ncbi:hypothetical protein PGB28_03995 [Primorskyibacter aestuariivivens]|uniref:hypothetical protein n=1 Tax=Primorskyibacter aestuariivivens TaxID=1888912 RepID=UPI0023018EB3|nr:hypothetical protein [Primorskyibacter aestuariivivens]MDA7427608.1 hypothetical protein [Primorskyibacter aestuariivivens]
MTQRIDPLPPYRPWLPVALIALAVLVALAVPQFLDPFVRHDDYSALFGTPEGYVVKALGEMRWLGMLWHMRGWIWPAPVNFALFMALSVIWSAAFAVQFSAPTRAIWVASAVALLAAANVLTVPQSLWFNTLIPGMAVLAAYALACLRMGVKARLMLLFPTVFLSFLSYTTYPMLAVLTCLADPEMHTRRRIKHALILLCLGVAAAILLSLSLNYLARGELIPKVENWRHANTNETPERLAEFIEIIARQVMDFRWSALMLVISYPIACIILWRNRPEPVLFTLLILIFGGLPLIALSAVGGIRMTAYAFIFVPATLVYAIALAFRSSLLGRVVLVALCITSLVETSLYYRKFTDWQADTRAISALVPSGAQTIYIYGPPLDMRASNTAGLIYPEDIILRLKYLTGREVILCMRDADACPAGAGLSWGASNLPEVEATLSGRDIAFRISAK